MKKIIVGCVIVAAPFWAVMAMSNSPKSAEQYGGINYALMSNIAQAVPAEESQANQNISSVTIGDPSDIGVINVSLSSEDHAQGIAFGVIVDVVQSLMKAGQNPTKVNFGFCVFTSMPATTLTGQAAVHPIGHTCYNPYTDSAGNWVSDES
jgi:hypothetical protein